MYAFARRPLWLLSHLLVFLLIVAMLWACLWQLARRTEVSDRNTLIEARADTEPQSLTEVLSRSVPGGDVAEELEWQPVFARGVFDRSEELLVRNRPFNGAPGSWALTPLDLGDGTAVLVNRGWIPRRLGPEDNRSEVDPPTEEVAVIGWLRPTETQQGLQASDPSTGELISVARPDIARIQQQIDLPLRSGFIQMEQLNGTAPDLPAPVPLPELDGGPHLSYAAQWAIFSAIAIIGYPLILRRVARSRDTSGSFEERPRT